MKQIRFVLTNGAIVQIPAHVAQNFNAVAYTLENGDVVRAERWQASAFYGLGQRVRMVHAR